MVWDLLTEICHGEGIPATMKRRSALMWGSAGLDLSWCVDVGELLIEIYHGVLMWRSAD